MQSPKVDSKLRFLGTTSANAPRAVEYGQRFRGARHEEKDCPGSWYALLDKKKEGNSQDKLSEPGLMTVQPINHAVETLSGGHVVAPPSRERMHSLRSSSLWINRPPPLATRRSKIVNLEGARHTYDSYQPKHAESFRSVRPNSRSSPRQPTRGY